MSRTHISKALRELVGEQARHRCGYCLTQETVIGARMEIDHLVPEALGGVSTVGNLWLACAQCNAHKADRVAAVDPHTERVVRLYDPRRQRWVEHFAWSERSDQILGVTATGRATIAALHLNAAPLVRARRIWVVAGWHPPRDL